MRLDLAWFKLFQRSEVLASNSSMRRKRYFEVMVGSPSRSSSRHAREAEMSDSCVMGPELPPLAPG
jgi:hypothetical protein